MSLVFKSLYRLDRLGSWAWRWVQQRFTLPGLTILGTLMVAGVMGTDTDNNVAYQGFTVLFFLLLVAAGFSISFRARFSARRLLPRFGTVGCPLNYSVRVQNLTAKPQAGLSLLENLADSRPSFQDWLAVQLADKKQARSFRFSQRRRTNPLKKAMLKGAPIPTIAPKQQSEVQLEVTPLRRGMLRFASLLVARPDPFGLFRALARVPLPETVLILPKRYPLPPIALPGTMKYQEGGVALSSSVGQSDEFVALRDYRHGDPLRHIHWRSWARTGKPVVKEFEDEFFVRHALVL
ncbi:MAG TPA: DUF58 domain-containing protein, partial [Bacillota bacterium]|nr:DUF58 domain-containing protein [Bacillota bacterium]